MAWVTIREYLDEDAKTVRYQRDDTIGAHRLMVNGVAGDARNVKFPCRFGNSLLTGYSWIGIAYDPHFLVAVEGEFSLAGDTATISVNDPIIARFERVDT